MSMIEKVALALVIAKFGPDAAVLFEPVPSGFPQSQEAQAAFNRRIGEARAEARAAIEAMREPTTEMLRGLLVHRGYDPDAKEETLDALGQLDVSTMGALVGNYRAMIDAILAEGQTP